MSVNDGIVDILGKLPALASVGEAGLRAMAAICGLETLPERTVVYGENDDSCDLYYLVSGLVELRCSLPSSPGEHMELLTLRSGSVFGITSFLDEARRDATATTRERTIVVRLAGKAFRELCAGDTALGYQVYRSLGKESSRRSRDVMLELRSLYDARGGADARSGADARGGA